MNFQHLHIKPSGTAYNVYLPDLAIYGFDTVFSYSFDPSTDEVYIWCAASFQVSRSGRETTAARHPLRCQSVVNVWSILKLLLVGVRSHLEEVFLGLCPHKDSELCSIQLLLNPTAEFHIGLWICLEFFDFFSFVFDYSPS